MVSHDIVLVQTSQLLRSRYHPRPNGRMAGLGKLRVEWPEEGVK